MAFNNAHQFHVENLLAAKNVYYPIHPSTSNDEPDAAVLDRLEKAASLGAGHQSGERFDPPKCHPDTRVAVINDIMSWVNESEPGKRIMWLNAPAGGGKSSIAQTIAERCDDEHKLLSSFFFSRTATTSGRDDGARLIPTIAYHLAIALPEAKDYILAVIRRNPAILSSSMDAQMRNLVVKPFERAIMAHVNAVGMQIPQLVVVDGLDECNRSEVQSMILKVIAGIVVQPSVHLRFLIASRPEWEIRKTFNLATLIGIYLPLTLDDFYEPEKDIEIYLKSEFSAVKRIHPLGKYLSNWPSEWDLISLVNKSSGQFIYASTVIKFIVNDRGDPRDRLKSILNMSTVGVSKKSPYEHLDALYIHILSTAADKAEDGYNSFRPTLEVLLYSEQSNMMTSLNSVHNLADFLGLDCSRLQLLLVDLHSILKIPHSDSPDLKIRFFHASFSDFMKDSFRSKEFFIPEDRAHVSLGHHCVAILSDPELSAEWYMYSDVQKYAKSHYFWHLKESNFDDELLNVTRSRNMRSFLDRILSRFSLRDFERLLKDILEYQVSADESGRIKIFPAFEKLGDIFHCILEVFDDSEGYCQSSVCWYIYRICIISRNRNILTISELYDILKLTCIEDPVRGKRKSLFMCDETCRNLFQDLCHNMTTPNFEGCFWWDWIDVMKYLLGKIESSYAFGIFLRGELPRIRSFLFNEPFRSRGIPPWGTANDIPLKEEILMEFKEDVHRYLNNSNVPIGDGIDFSSTVIALSEALNPCFPQVDK